MNNMRGYSIAMYPETKRKLEVIKNEKEMTWDELFNYLMEVKESKNRNKKYRKDHRHEFSRKRQIPAA